MANQGVIASDLSARFPIPGSPVWYVGWLFICSRVLHSLSDFDRVSEESYLRQEARYRVKIESWLEQIFE